ncbi:hypothetical protein [Acetobacter sicerae]|nr:hypothetical protein [Acetobacter sicerae]
MSLTTHLMLVWIWQMLQDLWYFTLAQSVFRSRLDALLPSAPWLRRFLF